MSADSGRVDSGSFDFEHYLTSSLQLKGGAGNGKF
jgi:hypothetical protein